MGQYIVKLKEHYLIWSSTVDAPISEGMNLHDLKDWIREEYGRQGMEQLPARLARVEAKGTSSKGDDDALDTIWLNRAGPDEKPLTIVGIYRHYCLGEEIQDEWIVAGRVMGGDERTGLTYEAVTAGWEVEPSESIDYPGKPL